ncbi:hypothetical protein SPRG_22260, partial [Saprolegnia parasitica CBS 223.65]
MGFVQALLLLGAALVARAATIDIIELPSSVLSVFSDEALMFDTERIENIFALPDDTYSVTAARVVTNQQLQTVCTNCSVNDGFPALAVRAPAYVLSTTSTWFGMLPSRSTDVPVELTVQMMTTSSITNATQLYQRKLTLDIIIVTEPPVLAVAVSNRSVAYATPAVLNVTATGVSASESLAVRMRVWNCSGVASVVVTSGGDMQPVMIDADTHDDADTDTVTDVCLYELWSGLGGVMSGSMQVNVTVADGFFGWTTVEVTATSTTHSASSATVTTTALQWLPNTAPMEILLPTTHLEIFEDEAVFLATSAITSPIQLPADYALTLLEVVTNGVWIQGICGPCDNTSAMGAFTKQFDGHWSGNYNGEIEFYVDVAFASPILGHRPMLYRQPHQVDIISVATVPQLSLAPMNTTIDYGKSASIWASASSDDASEAVRMELRPHGCDSNANVTANGAPVPLTWTSAGDCVYAISDMANVTGSSVVVATSIAMPVGFFGLAWFDVVATSTDGAARAEIASPVSFVWLPNPAIVYEAAVTRRLEVFNGVAVDVSLDDIRSQVNASMNDYVNLGFEILASDAHATASVFTVSRGNGITELSLNESRGSFVFTDFADDVRAGVVPVAHFHGLFRSSCAGVADGRVAPLVTANSSIVAGGLAHLNVSAQVSYWFDQAIDDFKLLLRMPTDACNGFGCAYDLTYYIAWHVSMSGPEKALLQSPPVEIEVQAITGFAGASTTVPTVVAEAVDTVVVTWQPSMSTIELLPVVIERSAFASDAVHPSMADIEACIGVELLGLGYSVSRYTVATTDPGVASIDVNGIPMLAAATATGLQW